jgi:hypothetical protein
MDEARAWLGVSVFLSRQNRTGRDHCTPAANIKGVNGTGTYFAGFSRVPVATAEFLEPICSDLMAPAVSGTGGKTTAIQGA